MNMFCTFQLPGRTDNEIKNFWNTRMKRRQRAGLPLYPPEVHAQATAYHHHLQQQQHHLEQPFSSSSSSSPSSSLSFSLLLSSCYPKKLDDPTHYSALNPLQNHPDSTNHYTKPCQQFKFSNQNRGNGTLALPLSSIVSPYASSSSTLSNQSFAAHNSAPTDSRDYPYSGSLSYDHGITTTSPCEPFPLVPGSTTEISSSQTTRDSATPVSSYASGADGLMGASSMVNDYYQVSPSSPQQNSGLLDALVMEAKNLCSSDKSKSEDSTSDGKISYKRKSMAAEEHTEEGGTIPVVSNMKNSGDNANETQREDISSSQLSTGEKSSLFLCLLHSDSFLIFVELLICCIHHIVLTQIFVLLLVL